MRNTRRCSSRILVVVSHRPEYRPLWTDYSHVTALALNNLGRIQDLPVIDDAVLDQDSRYRLRLRARLSTRQYPAALRVLFFWRSQWQLESEWYAWTLER